jgi:hypothetical protein
LPPGGYWKQISAGLRGTSKLRSDRHCRASATPLDLDPARRVSGHPVRCRPI